MSQRQATHHDVPAPNETRGLPGAQELRLARQLHAIDAWNAFRRHRDRELTDPDRSRHEQMFARIELASMERTHDAVMERVGLGLARSGEPSRTSSSTVVIAHRSHWFGDRVREALEQRGMTVLETTDNGAWAMGVVIAEQPDCLFVSDRLVMMPGVQLLAHAEWYSPGTRRVVHAMETPEPELRGQGCTVLRPRLHADEVADTLLMSDPTA